MPRMAFRVVAALSLAGSSFIGFAQSAPAPAKSNSPRAQQPYTAEFKITSVQTLVDGTTITHESTEISARDSQYRSVTTTSEQTPDLAGQPPRTFTHAWDPVERTNSNWDSRSKKARVMVEPPADQAHGCWTNDAKTVTTTYGGPRPSKAATNGTSSSDGGSPVPAPRPKPQEEDLGTTTIQGIEVHERRQTTTIQVGEIGNDRPIVMVSEYWASPSLGITLREIHENPREGTHTRELVSISLEEPDPALFQPPEGYEVTRDVMHQIPCQARQ